MLYGCRRYHVFGYWKKDAKYILYDCNRQKNLIPVFLMEKENNKMHVLCISPIVDYYAHTILYCFPIKSDQAHIRSMCLPSLDYTIKASSAQLAKITWQNWSSRISWHYNLNCFCIARRRATYFPKLFLLWKGQFFLDFPPFSLIQAL